MLRAETLRNHHKRRLTNGGTRSPRGGNDVPLSTLTDPHVQWLGPRNCSVTEHDAPPS